MQVVSSRQRWVETESAVQCSQVYKLAERRNFSHGSSDPGQDQDMGLIKTAYR